VLRNTVSDADDIVLLTTSENDLQTALTEMDNISLTFKLNISTEKNKIYGI